MAPSNPRVRLWSSLLLGLLACLLVPVAQAEMKYGINAKWGGGGYEELVARFALARSLGVKQVRIDWEWRLVEGQKGVYDWTPMDNLVKAAAEQDIELLPIVHYAPNWALPMLAFKSSGTYELAPSSDYYDNFAAFIKACIERYGPATKAGITYWQIWNEPNTPQFWGPSPKPKDFVKMMKAVSHAVAEQRASIKLVHAGISRNDITYLWMLWDIDPSYGEYFDILAVHPYLFNKDASGINAPQDMDADESSLAKMGFVGSKEDNTYLGKLFNLQLFMHLRQSSKPIWITELGYVVAAPPLGVTEAQQSAKTKATLDYINQHLSGKSFGKGLRGDLPADVERVYWFSLEDYESPDGLGNFGLIRADGTERPAAAVYRQYAQ
jgi:hypothetical protein